MEATCTISKVERIDTADEIALAFGGRTIPGRHGWVVTVEMSDGARQIVSRVDGDSRWIVDGVWPAGRTFPRFWNGAMSRCTALQPAVRRVAEAATEAVAEAQLDRLFVEERS